MKQGVPDSKPLANTTFVVKTGRSHDCILHDGRSGPVSDFFAFGHYSISKKDWNSRVGFYGPFEVDIAAGQIKKVQWNCDTGMQ